MAKPQCNGVESRGKRAITRQLGEALFDPGAGIWVIGTATALQGVDIPATFPECDRLFTPEEWINGGDAIVIKPTGAIAAGPLNREKAILFADIDVEEARNARRSLDVCGHYCRPDIFSLSVSRKPLSPIAFSD